MDHVERNKEKAKYFRGLKLINKYSYNSLNKKENSYSSNNSSSQKKILNHSLWLQIKVCNSFLVK